MGKIVVLVAAMGRNRAIGMDGGIPWRLPAELRHFKRTTMDKAIVMGRRTWESIGRPLPGRQNVVVTRDRDYRAEGCTVVHSVEAAVATAQSELVMVIGGGQLYRQALPLASRMVLTVVDASPEADTWFPEWDEREWVVRAESRFEPDEDNPLGFTVMELTRVF